ncbi:hypothetical protein AAHC03_022875 [Spirometra sp. Aus1]
MWIVVLTAVVLNVTPTAYGETRLDQLFTNLWNSDKDRIAVGPELQLNWQGEVSRNDRGKDQSAAKLCEVQAKKLSSSPVYSNFKALLDNYKADVGVSEQETAAEKKEQEAFLDSLMQSPIIKEVHKYLVSVRLAPAAAKDFKELLRKLWFTRYRRVRSNDSSAFEHVFVGEIKNGEVSGFHNWVSFCEQEAKGEINYHGFFRTPYREPTFKRSLRFTWKSHMKPKGTLLFGASVDFEMGLYTTIYLISKRDFNNSQHWPCVRVNIGRDRICVQCHDFKGHIGSCYVV